MNYCVTTLKKFGIENAGKEAETLITHALGIDRVRLYRDNPELDEFQIKAIEALLKRRLKHEPIQYILGYVEFLGLKISVGSGVLIPRPETELLVEEAIKTVGSQKIQKAIDYQVKILDLCTGSGCIAIALAKKFPETQVYGIDTSEIALGYAKKNAEINGVKNVTFLKGSLFQPIAKLGPFDLIASNPPYIASQEIKGLQQEIKDWEPLSALDGGTDGLDFYRAIINDAGRFLSEGGFIALEIGAGQAEKVTGIMRLAGLSEMKISRDYAGIERIVISQKPVSQRQEAWIKL
ncbi:MAG TPA: peptide chain release factor N(5)-glutamine methyltransferase [Nitrospiraceae bacterium]|nr:peptide chain release factor N(5)-glutamine methyltransferase [Nitrospiraceae bacterium]